MSLTESLTNYTRSNTTMLNSSMQPEAGTETHTYVDIVKQTMLMSQNVMSVVGAVANFATMFVLRHGGSGFAGSYLLLLKNQALVDFLVCTCSTIIMLQKPMWRTGDVALDTVVCAVWHSQLVYWVCVSTSVWNLVMIAYERFLAICRPFRHVDLTVGRTWRLVGLSYLIGSLTNSLCTVQTSMRRGACVSEYAIPGAAGQWVFYVYGPVVFVTHWLAPVCFFIVLYGRVTFTLLSRRDNSSFGESTLVNAATSQMTKTAVAVTIIFICSLSWDIWYYMLGRLGFVIYIKNSVLQLIGLWLSTFNSLCNPFVYLILLPAFRRATVSTLLPCVKVTGKGVDKKGTNTDS